MKSRSRFPSEKLLTAVEGPRLQELFSPDDPERLEELGPDGILTALPAGEREVPDAGVIAPRQPCHEERVLVVRMRTNDQDAPRGSELQDLVENPGGGHAWNRTHLGGRADGRRNQKQKDTEGAQRKECQPTCPWSRSKCLHG